MAEILAVASGIAGLLSLSIEVFRVSKAYVEGVHGASKSVVKILHELKSLKQVLWELDDLYAGENQDPATALSFKYDTKECEETLKELRDNLLRRVTGNPHLVKLKMLTWPFSESNTIVLIEKLHRYLQLFQASVNINTNSIVRDTQKSIQDLKDETKGEKFQSVLNWLSSMNVQQRQDAEFAKRCPSAGSWLINDGRFLKWKGARDNAVLWCPGDPGSGKTVMTSIIVDHIYKTSVTKTTALAYVYGDYKSSGCQTSSELLACLAKQLAASRSQPTKELMDLAAILQGESRRPNLQQSKELLQSLCRGFSRVFLVVDALDELRKSERGMFVFALLDKGTLPISLLFTSRPDFDDIQSQLKDIPRLPIRAADADIRLYIYQQIREDENFGRRIGGFEANLIDAVVNSAAGMFLLAVLQLNKLASLRTASKIQQALKRIPTKFQDRLAELYDDSIERIKRQEEYDAVLGINILQWLAHAKMPMKVDELRHALAVEWEEGGDPPGELDRGNVCDAKDLMDVCAGLVTLEEHSYIIRLVHFTTQEYLNERLDILFPKAEIKISRICLTYLSFSEFAQGHKKSDQDFEKRLDLYPFLNYASCAFGLHLRGQPEMELDVQALKLLQNRTRLAAINQVTHTRNSNSSHKGYSQNFPQNVNCLHVTAALGLASLNRKLLEMGEDPNQRDSLGRTALHYASSEGHLQLIRQMQGAGIDTRDNFEESALHRAIQNGQVASVQPLLEFDAGIESVKGGYSALHLACRYGRECLVGLFLETGANLETRTFFASTALHIAAENGHHACVKKLLSHGATVNTQDNNGHAPLHLASREGFLDVVQILLAHGADVHQTSFLNDKSPLHLAAETGNSTIIEILLISGANADLKDLLGMTALHHAALSGMQSPIECLVRYCSSFLEVDCSGRTAFDCAELWQVMGVILYPEISHKLSKTHIDAVPGYGHRNPAMLSVDKSRPLTMSTNKDKLQAPLAARETSGGLEGLNGLEPPIHHATWTGELDLVQSLLDCGVDVNAKGLSQSTALHRASARGNSAIVSLLLSRGADTQCNTTDGKTVLGYAVMNGHLDVMRILIEEPSTDVNSGVGGWTALHGAAKYGRSAATRMLTDAGANCRAIDSRHKIPLHWAAEKGHSNTFRILLDADAEGDVDVLDETHRTPLHLAALKGQRSIVEMLLSRGASKSIKDPCGFVARQLADIGRYKDLVNLLT